MTAFSDLRSLTQPDDATEQVKKLQHAVHENRRKLEEVQKQRQRAEEEVTQCTRETEHRVELMMEKNGVVDMLQQLGHMLQEERHLSEQLNGQASEDRNEMRDLQEKGEHFTNKARSLAAEILEVTQHLAEVKARNTAAKALIHAQTNKSQRNQRKHK